MTRAPTTATTTNAPDSSNKQPKAPVQPPASARSSRPDSLGSPRVRRQQQQQQQSLGTGSRAPATGEQRAAQPARKAAVCSASGKNSPARHQRVERSEQAADKSSGAGSGAATRIKLTQNDRSEVSSGKSPLKPAQSDQRKRKQQQQQTMLNLEGKFLSEMASSLVAQTNASTTVANTTNLAPCRYEIINNTTGNSHDEHRKQNHCEIEKRRRDKMNHYIMELASVIPSFSNNQNQPKFDKLTVLRMAVQHVKSLRSSLCSFSSFHLRPSFLSSGNLLKNLILQMASQEAQDNLFMVVTCNRGKVLFVSESSKDILNQDQDELVGQCLFDLLHKDDVLKVKEQISYFNLMPKEMLVDSKTLEPIKHGRRQSFSQLHQNHHSSSTPQPGARRSFFCRIKSSRSGGGGGNMAGQQHPLLPLLANFDGPGERRLRPESVAEAARRGDTAEQARAKRTGGQPDEEETGKSEPEEEEDEEEEEEDEEHCRRGNSKGSSSSLSSSSGASSDGNSASNESSNSSMSTGDKGEEKKKKKGAGGSEKLPVGSSNKCSSKQERRGGNEEVRQCGPGTGSEEAIKQDLLTVKTPAGAYQAASRLSQAAAFGAPPRGLSKKHWRYIVMHCTGYLKKITLRADEFDEDDLDELDYNNGAEVPGESSGDEENQELGARPRGGSRPPTGGATSGDASGQSRTIDCLVAVCRRSPINRDLKPDRPLTFTCRYSMEGKFVFVDQRTTAALGYTPQQLLGTSHYAYCHKDSVNTFKECHRQSILNSEPVSSDIYQFKRANGQHLWLQTSLKSFRNPWTKFIDYIVANHTTAEGNQPLYNEGCVPTKFNQDMTLCGEVGGGSQSSSPASTLSLPSMDSSCKKATSSSPSGSSIGSSYSMDSYNSATSGGIQALLQQIDRVKSGGGPARHLDLHKLHQSNHHLHHHSHHHHHHHHHHPNRAGGSLSTAHETGSAGGSSGASNSGSGSARKSNEDSGNYSDPQSCSSLFSQNSAGSGGVPATTSVPAEFTQQQQSVVTQLPVAKRAPTASEPPAAPAQTHRAPPGPQMEKQQQLQTSASYFKQQQQPQFNQAEQLDSQTGSYPAANGNLQYSGEQHAAAGKMSRAGAQAKSNQRSANTNSYSSANPNQNQHYGHQYRTQTTGKPAAQAAAAAAANSEQQPASQWPPCSRNSYSSSVASSGTGSAGSVSSGKSLPRSSSEICGMPSVQARSCQSSLNRTMQQRHPQQHHHQPASSYANVVRQEMPMVVSRQQQQQQQQQQVPMQTSQHEEQQTGSGAGYAEMMPYEMPGAEYANQPMAGVIQQQQQQPTNSMVSLQQQQQPQRLAPLPIIWGAGRPETSPQTSAGSRMAYGQQQQLAAANNQHLCHEGADMMALEVAGAPTPAGGQLMGGQPAIVVHCQCLKCPSVAMPCCQMQQPTSMQHQHLQQPGGQQHQQLQHHQHQHQHQHQHHQQHHHQQQQHQHHQPHQQQHQQQHQHQPHQQQQQQPYMSLANPCADSDFNSMNLTSLAVDGDYDEDQLLEFLAGYEPEQQLYNIQDNVYSQYNVYR